MSEPTTVQLTETDPAYTPPQDSAQVTSPAAAPDVPDPSLGRLSDLKAARGPLVPTAIDAYGVERIVGPTVNDNWKPAQVEPDPVEVARLEGVAAQHAAWRDERLNASSVPAANLGDGAAVAKGVLEAERA